MGNRLKAVDIGEWSICGGGRLETFYCMYIYIYIQYVYSIYIYTVRVYTVCIIYTVCINTVNIVPVPGAESVERGPHVLEIRSSLPSRVKQ